MTSGVASGPWGEPLSDLSAALQAVHGRLVAIASRDVSRREGRRLPPSAVFRHLRDDPELSWIGHLTRLIADIDELRSGAGPLTAATAAGVRAEVERLLVDPDRGFAPRYLAELQADPAVVAEHAAVRRALARLPGKRAVD